MEIDAEELTGLAREFGNRFNQTIQDDIESLPPAGRLYPKFYVKPSEMKWLGRILYRNDYPFPLKPSSVCWFDVHKQKMNQKRAFKIWLKDFQESTGEIGAIEDLLRWFEHQTLQGRFTYPMILIGLPSKYSEQAKFDREKGFHPMRITYKTSPDDDKEELIKHWPGNRVPEGFEDEEDIDAEGKYNHEVYENLNPVEVKSSDSSETSSSSESDMEEVPDYSDSPLAEF